METKVKENIIQLVLSVHVTCNNAIETILFLNCFTYDIMYVF